MKSQTMVELEKQRDVVTKALHDMMGAANQVQTLAMQAHRDGFNEACDLLGAPKADTPMERIALAGKL